MPVANVTPNATYFQGLCKGRKRERVAKELETCVNTLRRLTSGKQVAERIVKQIARIKECPISDLTVESPESLIPVDASFFTSLRYGWWIGPKDRGGTRWFHETVKFNLVKVDDDGVLHLGGKIKNQLNQVFEITAVRRNKSHFSLMAVCDDGTTWDGCLMICKDGVLCGVWSGYPTLLEPKLAIYRYFISKKKLSLEELQSLTKQVKIECHREADEFA